MDRPELTQSVALGLLQSLTRHGVEYVFANAGTDFAPVIEALCMARETGIATPRFQAIPHENLAVAMAHGYYAISGKPPVAMVHTTVGSANAALGVINAARDHIPLVLLAGRTPLTQAGHIASRTNHIHWGQESFDQGGMLREYLKWDYELRAGQPVADVIGRAIEIAFAEPRGPVYLTLPREVLAEVSREVAVTRFAPASRIHEPAPESIARLAELLAAAERPLIITSYLGQDTAAVAPLEAVAEQFAIPVVQPLGRYVNITTGHPMNVGFDTGRWLQEADVVLVVDCEMPWTPSREQANPRATIAHLGLDPAHARYPFRAFPSDLNVCGSPRAGLKRLGEALAPLRSAAATRIEARRARINAVHEQNSKARRTMLAEVRGMRPIAPAWLGQCVAAALPRGAVVVNELGVPTELLRFDEPGTFIGNGMAGGLGFALGGALGAKLAAPGKFVAVTLGNGSYMFGNPTPFHHVSRSMNLPVLTVIQNNSRWQAVDASTRAVYPAGHAAAADPMPLVDLGPSPEFCKVAEASGAYAEKVTEPDALTAALERAVREVENGRQALLDVITGVKGPRQA